MRSKTLNNFPDFIHWLSSLKDPRKFWTYETEVMLMTVIMRKFEDARLLGKYWMVIFDATGLFHFKERHCLKKVLDKGTEKGQAVYYHHVLEAKLVLGEGPLVH